MLHFPHEKKDDQQPEIEDARGVGLDPEADSAAYGSKALYNQAFQPSYSIPMRLPFRRNDNFTGRDPELAEIHRTLHCPGLVSSRQRVMALHGLGGIGKTQLAIQYAYIHQKDYTSVWWVNASTTQSLSQGFVGIAQQLLSYYARETTTGLKPDNAQIAEALGLPPDVVSPNGMLTTSRDVTEIVVNAIIAWFAAEENNQWLLIIDNYDDLGNVNIFDFLHTSSSGSILITSRSQETCPTGKRLEVQEVTEDEALEILRKSAQRDTASFEKEQSDAVLIVKKLGALPLALDQAGSYISSMQIAFSEYLPRFESAFAEIAAKKPSMAVWQSRDDTVFTTWEVSFNALGPAAQELLLLFGFLDNESIPEEMLPLERLNDGLKIDSVDDAIVEIFSLSLAKRRDHGTIWVHPLVHEWSRERLDQSNKRRKVLQAISLVAASVSFRHGFRKEENWIKERAFLPHIRKCFHHICLGGSVGDMEADASQRSDVKILADVLVLHGEFAPAAELYRWALSSEERALGDGLPDTLSAVHHMAVVLLKQAKYGESLEWFRRALAEEVKSPGEDHPGTLFAFRGMANAFYGQEKFSEALEWYRRALAGQERALGKHHPDTLITVHNMANVFCSQENYDEALECYERALAGAKKPLDNDHREMLSTVYTVADGFLSQERYDEALEWYGRILSGTAKSLGKSHPERHPALVGMANAFMGQQKYDQALTWYRRVLSRNEKSLGNNHPTTLSTVFAIASVFTKQGKHGEALVWHRRALDGAEELWGKDHPQTLFAIYGMASAAMSLGRYGEALEWIRRVLPEVEKALGMEHPATLATVFGMATALLCQGEHDKALESFERVLTGVEKSLGDLITLAYVTLVLVLFLERGQRDRALVWTKRALDGQENILGKSDPIILSTVRGIADELCNLGMYDEALEWYMLEFARDESKR